MCISRQSGQTRGIMDWIKIDLWPKGKAGIEAKYRIEGDTLYCFVLGSNHPMDWLHHIIPGAAKRELEAGRNIMRELHDVIGVRRLVIGGHSLGAAVAVVVGSLMSYYCPVEVCVFGGKRTAWAETVPYAAYRHKGDIVPFFPPWRPKYENAVFGKWRPPWKAHGPQTYHKKMKEKGLR